MDGRRYTISWDAATAVTVAIDVFGFLAASGKPIYIEELTMWQTSDFGDANDEVIGVEICRGNTTVGSGGTTSVLAGIHDDAGTAIAATTRARDTTQATAGTVTHLHLDGWNIRAPYIWVPPSDDWRPFSASTTKYLCVRLLAAPADSITMNASCLIRELG